MNTRRKHHYFEREENSPKPVTVSVNRRCQFSDVDALAIVWHGRYVNFFEEASAELGRKCGLTYEIMQREGIAAPIAQLHIDYYHPLRLSEICTIQASLIWSEASRLNIEYLISVENGSCACCGYTVQMFVTAETREVCILSPDILVKCRTNWQNGMFHE